MVRLGVPGCSHGCSLDALMGVAILMEDAALVENLDGADVGVVLSSSRDRSLFGIAIHVVFG